MELTNVLSVLTSNASGTGSMLGMLLPILLLFAFMYFFIIRPQQKEQKSKEEMRSSLEVGDTVMTTSGFYGTIIDITEDTVIVEFGNNKNCRIPMQKEAILENEKPKGIAEK